MTVRETGPLGRIASRYMEIASDRIKPEIAARARQNLNGTFDDDFVTTYDLTGTVFGIGNTTIGGTFSGNTSERVGTIEMNRPGFTGG